MCLNKQGKDSVYKKKQKSFWRQQQSHLDLSLRQMTIACSLSAYTTDTNETVSRDVVTSQKKRYL